MKLLLIKSYVYPLSISLSISVFLPQASLSSCHAMLVSGQCFFFFTLRSLNAIEDPQQDSVKPFLCQKKNETTVSSRVGIIQVYFNPVTTLPSTGFEPNLSISISKYHLFIYRATLSLFNQRE